MPSHHIPHCYTVQQSNLFGHVVRRFTAQSTRSVSAVSLRAFGGGGGGRGGGKPPRPTPTPSCAAQRELSQLTAQASSQGRVSWMRRDCGDVVVVDVGKDGNGLAEDQWQPHHDVSPLSLQVHGREIRQRNLHTFKMGVGGGGWLGYRISHIVHAGECMPSSVEV